MHHRAALAVLALFPLVVPSSAADVAIHADGRRQTVEDPRKDSAGRWMATVEGRRTPLGARVVALVDAKGAETVLIPELSDAPKSAEQDAALQQLLDPRNEGWTLAGERLAQPPSRAVLDELLALARSPKKELRGRAITALTWLPTRESALAAAQAVLAEKDVGLRRDGASALHAVREILRRCDSLELIQTGIADKDASVRVTFALLAPADLEPAKDLLRKEGLKHSDHHVRESAALELGRRGDSAGESILIAMLARTKLPGIDDPALNERYLIEEHVAICEVLAQFDSDAARKALEKAAKSPHEAVRKAAEAALQAS